jgi:hypothetical protein
LLLFVSGETCIELRNMDDALGNSGSCESDAYA